MGLRWLAAASAALGLGAASPAVSPPPTGGPWHQVGAALTSKPGKALHFFRQALNPQNLSVVVTSSSAKSIRLFWVDDCEVESDDGMTGQGQAVVKGVHTIIVYPPTIPGATLCHVSVNVNAIAGARVAAAVFQS
jgi:hypothetical protein